MLNINTNVDNVMDKIMSNTKQIEQYIIVDITNHEFFKDVDGNVKIFDDYDDALIHCGIYEFENAWICKLMYNYIEPDV